MMWWKKWKKGCPQKAVCAFECNGKLYRTQKEAKAAENRHRIEAAEKKRRKLINQRVDEILENCPEYKTLSRRYDSSSYYLADGIRIGAKAAVNYAMKGRGLQ